MELKRDSIIGMGHCLEVLIVPFMELKPSKDIVLTDAAGS